MYVTVTGAIVGSVLDATLIYGLGLGVHGAAIAAFVSHISMLAVGSWAVAFVIPQPQLELPLLHWLV